MYKGKRILAVVTARSGSKGIPNKNMRTLGGVSLIGWAGRTLAELQWLDAKVISTDSPAYADEGRDYGLDAPFLRPKALSGDEAGSLETMQHALVESERHYATRFDIALIVEPTSPLRIPEDLERITSRLIDAKADSAVCVSPLPIQAHPMKIMKVVNGSLRSYLEQGATPKRRQALSGEYYWRNGVGYALTRECLIQRQAILTSNTVPDVITRPVVNIDEPFDLEWAEFLLSRQGQVEGQR